MGTQILFSLIFLSIFSVPNISISANKIEARKLMWVSSLEGKATLVKSTKIQIPVKIDVVVEVGDIIVTEANSAVQINTGDGSVFRIGPNSQFVVEYNQNTSKKGYWRSIVNLMTGWLKVYINKRKDKNSIKHITKLPTGTIGVRGTSYTVFYDRSRQSDIGSISIESGSVLLRPKSYERRRDMFFSERFQFRHARIATKGNNFVIQNSKKRKAIIKVPKSSPFSIQSLIKVYSSSENDRMIKEFSKNINAGIDLTSLPPESVKRFAQEKLDKLQESLNKSKLPPEKINAIISRVSGKIEQGKPEFMPDGRLTKEEFQRIQKENNIDLKNLKGTFEETKNSGDGSKKGSKPEDKKDLNGSAKRSASNKVPASSVRDNIRSYWRDTLANDLWTYKPPAKKSTKNTSEPDITDIKNLREASKDLQKLENTINRVEKAQNAPCPPNMYRDKNNLKCYCEDGYTEDGMGGCLKECEDPNKVRMLDGKCYDRDKKDRTGENDNGQEVDGGK